MKNNDSDDDDMKIAKSRVSEFSGGGLKIICVRYCGVCTARYEPMSYYWCVMKAS